MGRGSPASLTPTRRFAPTSPLQGEALWHGRVENGRPFLMDGRSGKVSFRLLHVFDLRGGKIAAEQVWCDLAALQRQLGEAQ